ncbi:MAG: hypothetical protein K2W96_08980 [Gemmataceae bacterium]|nr:hypothetical protein [Gemmataceae bacterium]
MLFAEPLITLALFSAAPPVPSPLDRVAAPQRFEAMLRRAEARRRAEAARRLPDISRYRSRDEALKAESANYDKVFASIRSEKQSAFDRLARLAKEGTDAAKVARLLVDDAERFRKREEAERGRYRRIREAIIKRWGELPPRLIR